MMKRAEFDQVVRSFWKRKPFQPFVIEYEDGQRFIVKDPDAFGCYAGSATLFHPDGSLDIIENEEVSRVVDLNETPTT
jgi:hypothetical protein